jgi:hypothetical protein
MTLNIDLNAIARKAIKKATGKATAVELLEMFPAEKWQHNDSLEEGTLKFRLPELCVELRNIIYSIRPDKHVAITIPFRKQVKRKTSLDKHFIFTDQAVWQGILDGLVKQVVEDYTQRQAEET